MKRLLLAFALIYTATVLGVLSIGLRPVVPWSLAIGLICVTLPFGIVFNFINTETLLPSFAFAGLAVLAILAHSKTYWFVWAAGAIVILALANKQQRVAYQYRILFQGLGIMALGYASVWNLNYLIARFAGATHDNLLKEIDVWFYSALVGHPVSYTGLFPLIHKPFIVRLFDNSYSMLFSEIVLVLVLESQTGDARRVSRFLTNLFSLYGVGIACFLIYPAIGPCLAYPESISAAGAAGTSLEFVAGMANDYRASVSGGTLQGFGYFIAAPSLHVIVALFLQICLYRWPLLFNMFMPINAMIISSTFVLGYHYLFDIVYSVALVACFSLVRFKLRRWWWPGTESNRRRQPFQGCLPIRRSGLELAEVIEAK